MQGQGTPRAHVLRSRRGLNVGKRAPWVQRFCQGSWESTSSTKNTETEIRTAQSHEHPEWPCNVRGNQDARIAVGLIAVQIVVEAHEGGNHRRRENGSTSKYVASATKQMTDNSNAEAL